MIESVNVAWARIRMIEPHHPTDLIAKVRSPPAMLFPASGAIRDITSLCVLRKPMLRRRQRGGQGGNPQSSWEFPIDSGLCEAEHPVLHPGCGV